MDRIAGAVSGIGRSVVPAVFPDFSAVGTASLGEVVGALMTIILLLAVLMLVVGAAGWAVASAAGNAVAAGRFRVGALVALGAAVLDGGAIGWANFLLGLGPAF